MQLETPNRKSLLSILFVLVAVLPAVLATNYFWRSFGFPENSMDDRGDGLADIYRTLVFLLIVAFALIANGIQRLVQSKTAQQVFHKGGVL